MSSFLKSDIDSTKLYDAPTTSKKSLVKEFDAHISMTDFIDDLKLRYPKEFAASVQTLVYFYSDLSTYEYTNEYVAGLANITKNYIVFRPELITFVCYDEKTNKTNLIVKSKNIGVYARYGVHFETHIPCRKWDDTTKRYTHEIIPNKFKSDRELYRDYKINMIRIINKKQSYEKPKTKFDYCNKHIEYYNWKTEPIRDSERLARYMFENMKVEQFRNITSQDAIDDAGITLE